MPFGIDIICCNDCWPSLRDGLRAIAGDRRKEIAHARRAGDNVVAIPETIPGNWTDDADDATECDVCLASLDSDENVSTEEDLP